MRYYEITITDQQTGATVTPTSAPVSPLATYTSYANGRNLPGALDVAFDIPVTNLDNPGGPGDTAAVVQVRGVSLQEISQARDLTNKLVSVSGGFRPGLPLASAAAKYSGLLTSGYVLQAFGNWVGTEMTLDLVIASGFGPQGAGPLVITPSVQPLGLGTDRQPRNLVLNWLPGQTLGLAVRNALAQAFPGATIIDNTSPNLINTKGQAQVGMYSTAQQFAQVVNALSRGINQNSNYSGIVISQVGQVRQNSQTFTLNDGTRQSQNPKRILFQDLIGQPTWIDLNTVQFKCPMRADIKIGDFVLMPPALATTALNPLGGQQLRQSSTFKGQFTIQRMRHVGNFRQPDADSWVSTFDAAAQIPQGTANAATAGLQ